MNTDSRPPRWAESVLRLLLRPADRETVSGDLLEAYRDTVVPSRGQASADRWYVRQVAGFAWRSLWVWIVAIAAADLARAAIDWFVPTHDFHVRSAVTTWVAVGLFSTVGFVAAWRARDIRAATLAGFLTGVSTAVASGAGALLLLAIWHDPQTLAAIDASGGLAEALTLPAMIVVPATTLATMAGVLGRALSPLRGDLRFTAGPGSARGA
jgi:hypothetical protein